MKTTQCTQWQCKFDVQHLFHMHSLYLLALSITRLGGGGGGGGGSIFILGIQISRESGTFFF